MADLKLYVWEEVLSAHHDGIMLALAESEEQAKELIQKHAEKHYGSDFEANREMERVSPRLVTEPEGFTVYGGY